MPPKLSLVPPPLLLHGTGYGGSRNGRGKWSSSSKGWEVGGVCVGVVGAGASGGRNKRRRG
jgi:hypothetical protein